MLKLFLICIFMSASGFALSAAVYVRTKSRRAQRGCSLFAVTAVLFWALSAACFIEKAGF